MQSGYSRVALQRGILLSVTQGSGVCGRGWMRWAILLVSRVRTCRGYGGRVWAASVEAGCAGRTVGVERMQGGGKGGRWLGREITEMLRSWEAPDYTLGFAEPHASDTMLEVFTEVDNMLTISRCCRYRLPLLASRTRSRADACACAALVIAWSEHTSVGHMSMHPPTAPCTLLLCSTALQHTALLRDLQEQSDIPGPAFMRAPSPAAFPPCSCRRSFDELRPAQTTRA